MKAAEVEAAAKVLAPRAFGPPYKIGCDSPWHYEGHSFHSSCPGCGSKDHASREFLDRTQQEAQERAREEARKVIGAVDRLRRRERAQKLLGAVQ